TPDPGGPAEVAPGTWEPPPVRRAAEAAATAVVEPGAVVAAAPEAPPGVKARRRSRRLIAALAVVVIAVGAAAVWQVWGRQSGNEAERQERAAREYQDQNFADAATLYRNLDRDFPDSPNRPL